MPFPELILCRYLVGLSASQLSLHNVSDDLAKTLHWRMEVILSNKLKYLDQRMKHHQFRFPMLLPSCHLTK